MGNDLNIHRFQSKGEAAAAAGEALNSLLIKYKTQPVLLLLSGSSALALLDYAGQKSLGENLTITVLDERFTPLNVPTRRDTPSPFAKASEDRSADLTGSSQDQQINNFSGLQQTQFYTDALNANCNFLGTLPRNNESKEELAKRWEEAIKKWRSDYQKGKILATLGMGPDGHTAGIFPFPEDAQKFRRLFENGAWVTAYDVGNRHQYKERITTTLTFFKEIDEAIVFVCGEEKKEKFGVVISKQGKPNELPALGWSEIKKVEIFTDINDLR